ncbi:MAG: ATP-binding protein [Chloroflexota bacterium]|jgi:predicted ATPase
MAIDSQMLFRTTELNPDFLSTPCRVQTNWHVITGAPSCGKTTLIDLLANRGFQTAPESARKLMEGEFTRGPSINEVHENAATLQRRIAAMQLGVESRLSATDLVFLDGAVPGSLSWYRVFGLNPNEILPECFHHRYASVFVLDRLPLRPDGLRFKEDAHTGFLDEWIVRDYCALGYDVGRVPLLAPEERLAFVFETLCERGFEYPGNG